MRIKSIVIDTLGLGLGILCVVVGFAELFAAGLYMQSLAIFIGASGVFTAIFHNWIQYIFEEINEGDEEDGNPESSKM